MLDNKKKTIIIAEDELALNEIYVEILEDLGHKAIGFENGEDAYNYICSNKVDFVITDLKMPVMDGLTLLKKLREEHPSRPPVLIITGFLDQSIKKDAQELGVIDLIAKPFDFELINKYIE